ncbi:hypothetical protein [Sphingobium lignivorans]|uniref:DUF8021 domain-containing protein n=1 Tax=Sphingobium lignivorans TaxID=2735886 RepID=A0ABR6NGM1_9SPHN|nr:hypothetical protein [Sphingobium lignivorans]MBB5986429.1 hypothetical protein [Sphingobium lignivorans]
MIRLSLVAALLAVAPPGASVASPAPHGAPPKPGEMDCERACLESVMDAYLKAMRAHDASSLPLARDFRHTENGVELPLNKGFWSLGSDLGAYRVNFSDAARGEINAFATMQENGIDGLLTVRLKVVNKAIRESEIIVVRNAPHAAALNAKGVDPLWSQPVPAAQRLSRNSLIQVADRYFDAIEQDSSAGITFASDCFRLENGLQTTSNPTYRSRSFESEFQPYSLNCKDNIDSRFFDFVSRIQYRRYTIVDEERGIVVGMALFEHDGDKKTLDTKGGPVAVPPNLLRPSSVGIFEAFKVDRTGVRRIEAIGTSYAYGRGSGWD